MDSESHILSMSIVILATIAAATAYDVLARLRVRPSPVIHSDLRLTYHFVASVKPAHSAGDQRSAPPVCIPDSQPPSPQR